VYFFLRRLGKLFILNGLLIGAAVGAGFAAFESAGYAMSYLFQGGWDVMMNIIFLRGFLTPGGHVVWAAISGASLVIAIKEQNKISTNVFLETKFLRLFIIPVILHGIWDSPLSVIGSEVYFVPIGLTVLAWIVVLILINMGLVEVSKNQPNY
jgi:RsiW-degrading membrane proteinase PrsW (M82 family)